jgi:hypothetical protein
MTGSYQTRTARLIGIRCHCSHVRQRASAGRDIRFAVRAHRISRRKSLVAKTDLSPVPSDKSAIQAITPSQIYAWEGLVPDVDMTDYTEARLPSEEK